jgi:alanine racemase
MAALPEGGPLLPIVGRISMDCLGVDISALPEGRVGEGDLLDLIGPHWSLADAAAAAGTIGYEMLTSLGHRYRRRYATG